MAIIILLTIMLFISLILLFVCGEELVAMDKENEVKDLVSMKITFDGPSRWEMHEVTYRLLKRDRKRRTTRKAIWTIR